MLPIEETLRGKQELWRRGEISWKLRPDQLSVADEMERSEAATWVNEMARKYGKSYLGIWRQQKVLNQSPAGSRYVYGSSTYKALLEFILPVIHEFYDDCPDDMRPAYSEKTCHLERPDGSWTHFFGADDIESANRGRGPKAVEAGFDEAGFCPVLGYVIRSVFRPSLMLTPGAKTILYSSPAAEADHEFTVMAEVAEANGSYAHRTIYDNPMLTPEQIERFGTVRME